MINFDKDGIYTYKGVNEPYKYRTTITSRQKMQFIQFVTDNVVTDKAYFPIMRDLFFDFAIVNLFTDIDMEDTLSQVDVFEEFNNETGVAETVKVDIDRRLLNELNMAVDKSIEYKTGVKKNDISDVATSLLSMVEKKLENIDVESFMKFAEKMNEVQGDFTPAKMLEAYAQTDMFKDKEIERQNMAQKRNKTINNAKKSMNTKKHNSKNTNKSKSSKVVEMPNKTTNNGVKEDNNAK